MNIATLRKNKIRDHERMMDFMDKMENECIEPLDEMVRFVSPANNCIFIETVDTLSDVIGLISGYEYKNVFYYMENTELMVTYIINGTEYAFGVRDYAGALESLSGGKCKIECRDADPDLYVSCKSEEANHGN